jgi:aspartokinase/homoserine dehydrogenase 1
VIGVGNIGSTLLRELRAQRSHLLARGFDVTVVGLANSKKFVLDPRGIDLARWRQRLAASRRRMIPHALAQEITKLKLTDVALVDCTAAEAVVAAYPDFVQANLHIITPNSVSCSPLLSGSETKLNQSKPRTTLTCELCF